MTLQSLLTFDGFLYYHYCYLIHMNTLDSSTLVAVTTVTTIVAIGYCSCQLLLMLVSPPILWVDRCCYQHYDDD